MSPRSSTQAHCEHSPKLNTTYLILFARGSNLSKYKIMIFPMIARKKTHEDLISEKTLQKFSQFIALSLIWINYNVTET